MAPAVAVISALSNLSIQYNFAAITIALAFMDNGGTSPAYPRSTAESSLLKSLVFAGAITGQLTMGFAGDVLGRRRALLLTNTFSILGALGSALFTWGEPSMLYAIMGVCRFVLGVGVGGKYPLAATMSKEGASTTSASSSSVQVAKGFFWQTPGAMLPYIVALALLACFGKTNFGAAHLEATSLQFRLLLGLGALPTVFATVLTYRTADSAEYVAAQRAATSTSIAASTATTNNPFRVAAAHPELLRPLLGCGGSWMLYDFIYYGTSFNQVRHLPRSPAFSHHLPCVLRQPPHVLPSIAFSHHLPEISRLLSPSAACAPPTR